MLDGATLINGQLFVGRKKTDEPGIRNTYLEVFSMDKLGNPTSGQNAALVMFAFLEADCGTPEYEKELISLGKELSLCRDINFDAPIKYDLDYGDLETDGHLCSCIKSALDDMQPSVELLWPRGCAEAADLQQIAGGLREIADQFEENVVAQATRNLSRSISASPSEQWKEHLTREVDRVMRQGVGLEHLAQERVMVALTLTLVKGVCAQTPRLLRNLFNTALQYLISARAR